MIVTDANVIAYAFIPGPMTPVADAVFLKDPEWVAPALWADEMLNVVANYLRVGRMDEQACVDALALAAARVRVPAQAPAPRDVLALVASSRCSAYDCQYVALARLLGVPLVTQDQALLAAFPGVATSMPDYARP